ncbi:MAG TPA: protein-L-isoaspartate(D-aspartate) O-methyltransferase [Candidatus Marinimicrobia bacterium]|jgi:protein-L-isoaspartate(D-aspartate) O-methyltransferase|nr:protein-L-isoaspartate(D-aspartate) O-methyltransferase [Candidatus Neomarinimicrobiota bacterium]HPI28221.1 protein-L-isoaspartate(D-aspartate) O-methyltransferase [Candidatus Neomarinimicrobiota bacterium]HPN75179.1 protein-L-isoaspartate(D-aspartate) O-methyltransferase [Candidatus Neomarinimicrobiota bacterium]HQM36430.1 protein-L-isoaspartate(D-aspartate) O-methyltransferase [Candidatus Neomarinimicrobiota bacterium]HQQ85893.1 protein-L-isoaspartate(D-aspartate) O-methyltransferase [Can
MGSRIKTLLFLLSLLVILAMAKNPQDPDYYQLRQKMVNEQIIARGVRAESVIKAMQKVERHLFVPEQYRNFAYSDRPLPIGEGQTISQPYIVALMTELLDLKKSDKVLEIGTGSGYQAAILAEICDSVYTIEIIPSLGKQAQALLRELGYHNIHCKIGDGYLGWPEHAPYDGIIVTCAPSKIPQPLKEQLAEGGRMVIPVGATYTQELVLVTKTKGKLIQKSVIPVRFVPMLRSPNGLD